MAVNCFLQIGALTFYPELPVGREPILIAEDRRMLGGNLRRAYRGTRYRFTFALRDADEATRSAWVTAATGAYANSATYTDELGVARTVVVMSVREDLSRTAPAVEGGASTTGPGYYDLEVVAEEI